MRAEHVNCVSVVFTVRVNILAGIVISAIVNTVTFKI